MIRKKNLRNIRLNTYR